VKHTSLPCACLALLFATQMVAQTTKSFRISGVVVNSLNGSPVQRCHLTASPAGRIRTPTRIFLRPQPLGENVSTDTDAQGRFSLTLPGAGSWALRANAQGYATQAYEEHEGYSTAIVLTEQAPAMELRFRLLPEASVTGTVFDEAGEPVRTAHVSLFRVPSPGPDGKVLPMMMRSSVMTDDRGYYEFADLPEGDYKVMVQARPWYAASAHIDRGTAPAPNSGGPSGSALDPSLDVAYPVTWYPGRDDQAEAEILVLHAGDGIEANFRLLPVPAAHLRIMVPPNQTTSDDRRVAYSHPIIESVSPGSGPAGVVGSDITMVQGQAHIDGLAPGLYRVRLQGQESRTALVRVTGSAAQTLDFNEPSQFAELNITIHLDGAVGDESSVQVNLIDTATGQHVGNFFGNRPSQRGRQEQERPVDRTVQIPPGRYEVVLAGQPDLYLAGMTAQSAEVEGRYLKITGGNPTLTLHVARGKASVGGFVKSGDQPVPGAMVMLVPAGLGDPKSMTVLTRDQTNTDGSFNLPQVIPGQYILLAIDHGWQINWKDPSTLNRYLIHGIPLELRPGVEVKQDLGAQAP
jgi:hypothetical protein